MRSSRELLVTLRGALAALALLVPAPATAEDEAFTWAELKAMTEALIGPRNCINAPSDTYQANLTIQPRNDFCVIFGDNTRIQSDGGPHAAFVVPDGIVGTFFGGEFVGFTNSVIDFQPGSSGDVIGARFTGNTTPGLGGAVRVQGGDVRIAYNTFDNNGADVFGCALLIEPPPETLSPGVRRFWRNYFRNASRCRNVLVENTRGRWLAGHNTFDSGSIDSALIDSVAEVNLLGNILSSSPGASACRAFGSNAFLSLGANLSDDDSCFATREIDALAAPLAAGDLVAPVVLGPLVGGVASLPAGSAAIERGRSGVFNYGYRPTLPCGYRDARGLGAPQDADLDGVFACDSGAFEVQGGPDIGAPQSAAYFDPARNGEGSFVEILDNGLALVATFTYRADRRGPAWFVGLGKRVGNSVVVDRMLQPAGGAFGAAFNAAAIRNHVVGGASLVFPNCAAGSAPGQFTFEAGVASGFQDMLAKAQRLSTIVPCQTGATVSALAGRSGSYYAPSRSGEGIFVEFLPDGHVVVIWYTFDAAGNQLWIVSGAAQVSGNRVVLQMLYPEQSTRFGAQFNPAEITLSPWGTVTLDFTGCDTMRFSYDSTVAGYGSGGYDYVRLTRPLGTSCPP